ncbi:porin family protein [Fulvimonas yonginensis]|uniref:Porin family protein n=1 Tax=Fulvimonas yonginensis TaxID=1495200 RepID=A0ABU8JEL4_9GAMM
MNKTLLVLSLASAGLVVTPVHAQDAAGGKYQPDQAVGSGNWFIDANVGRTSGNSNGGFGSDAGDFNFFNGHRGRRTGYGVLGGYRWKVGQDIGLGVETGYTDLGNYRLRNAFNSDPVNQRSTTNALRGWLVGANARLALTPQWYLGAHAGWFRANDNNHRYYDTAAQELGFTDGDRAGRGSWYAGIGTGWDIDQHFGIGVQYDYFHANAGHYTNPATGARVDGPKRSTGIVSLTGEYRF